VLVLVLVVVGCATATTRVPPPRATNIVASPTQRIWVAGFLANTEGLFDVSEETVRRVRSALRREGAVGVIQADPVTIGNEAAFRDAAYWRTLGEEHGEPLIVTGTVRLRRAPPRVTPRGGRGGVYDIEPGFALEAEIVLIAGTTGRVFSAERLPRQVRYGSGRRASPSLMYAALIDSLMADVVRAVLASSGEARR
jgi:hypothetical protein